MSKMTGLFAASAAALIVACIVGATQARAPSMTVRIDPTELTVSAKQMPTQHFDDYTDEELQQMEELLAASRARFTFVF